MGQTERVLFEGQSSELQSAFCPSVHFVLLNDSELFVHASHHADHFVRNCVWNERVE